MASRGVNKVILIGNIFFVLASSPAPFKMIAFRRESKTGLNV